MKTDWKDDIFSGTARKWNIADNSDGTKTITDATEYTQEGDPFGAKELNEIGEEVNKIQAMKSVTLTASGWTGDAAPYSQTVAVDGITADDNPIIVSMLADGSSVADQKAYIKAFGYIASGTATTADGSVAFKVYKKPAINITIGLKGV